MLLLLLTLGCAGEPDPPQAGPAPAGPAAPILPAATGVSSTAAAGPPDVVLVVWDTVRADVLSTYGGGARTPNLDALARQGVRFDDVMAPSSWTLPSHASMFTGLAPWEHGARRYDEPVQVQRGAKTTNWQVGNLGTAPPTLAERFAAAGYLPLCFAANSWFDPQFGLTRGFVVSAVVDDATVVANGLEALRAEPGPLFLVLNLMGAHDPYRVDPAAEDAAALRQRLDALARATGGALVVEREGGPALTFHKAGADGWSPAMRLGAGRAELSAATRGLLADLYRGEIERLDRALGDIVAGVQARGRPAVVVVTSDHGERLGEHGGVGHGLTLVPEVVDVPLVVWAPGRAPEGRVIETPVELSAVHDTLLALADISGTWERDLLAPGAAGAREQRAALWVDQNVARVSGGTVPQDIRALRVDGAHWIEASDGTLRPAGEGAATGDAPTERLRGAMPRGPARPESVIEALPGDVEDALQALGYLDR